MQITITADGGEAYKLIQAIAGTKVTVSTVPESAPEEEPQTEEKKKWEPKKATKAMYYFHPDTNSFFMIKRGEEFPHSPEFEESLEMTKTEWDKRKALAAKPKEKQEVITDEKAIPQEIKNVVDAKAALSESTAIAEAPPAISLVDIKTAVKAKLMAKPDVRAKVAEMVGKFGADRLSNLDESKYVEFIKEVQAL